MTPFGKDVQRLEVVAADFLPDGNKLLFVVADAESNIHILQYDPERVSPPPPFLSNNKTILTQLPNRPQIPRRPTPNPPRRILRWSRNPLPNHAPPYGPHTRDPRPNPTHRQRQQPHRRLETRISLSSLHPHRGPLHDHNSPGVSLQTAEYNPESAN